MKIEFSTRFKLELKKNGKKDKKILEKIERVLRIFREDPKHNSLRLHKLEGKLGDYWSLSVETNFRLIFYYSKEGVIFVDMGTHDQVYKK